MARYVPKILNQNGSPVGAEPNFVTIPDATYSYGIAVGGWLTSTGAVCDATGDIPYYQVIALYDIYGRHITKQYLTTTELDAADHKAEVIRIDSNSGVTLEMGEDGVTSTITAAQADGTYYYDYVVAEPGTVSDEVNPYAGALTKIQIDSNTGSQTPGTLPLRVVRPSNDPQNPAYDGSTARNFQVVISGL